MDEKFIIVWTVDGETTSITHSTQDAALHQAEKLLRKHGCDLEITLHLDDEISPQPSIWFNKKADAAVVSCRIPGRPNLKPDQPARAGGVIRSAHDEVAVPGILGLQAHVVIVVERTI